MYGFTKGKGIFDTFTKHFEKREIDLRKIFAVTTDGAPVIMGQYLGLLLW